MSAEKPSLPAATPRFDTIDMMRGYSILAVVLLHTWLRLYFAGYDVRRPALPHMVPHLLFGNGVNGVTVFFAISGFLITLTSLRRFGSLSGMHIATFTASALPVPRRRKKQNSSPSAWNKSKSGKWGYGNDSRENGPYRGGQNSYLLATASNAP